MDQIKILYIAESISPFVVGGMQEVAKRHITYLGEKGYEVSILHSRVAYDTVFNHENNVELIRLPWPKEGWKGLRYPGAYASALHQYSMLAAQFMLSIKPQIIYAEGPVAKAILEMPERPPVIFHPHGLEVLQTYSNWSDHLRLWQLKRLIKFHCRYADYVLSQGGKLTEILVKKCGVPSLKIRVLPNSCDEPLRSGLQHTKRFLFVGRLEKRKGLQQLLQIFSMLPHLHLDVVGCDRMGKATDNITFHGIVRDREKLMQMYRDAFVLLVPSISEGMPTVILEAMSQGTPVIATDVGGCRDLVFSNKTGWLIESAKRNTLVKTIRVAADTDDNEYRELSDNCVKLIAEKFSSAVVRPALYAIIDEAINFGQRQK